MVLGIKFQTYPDSKLIPLCEPNASLIVAGNELHTTSVFFLVATI